MAMDFLPVGMTVFDGSNGIEFPQIGEGNRADVTPLCAGGGERRERSEAGASEKSKPPGFARPNGRRRSCAALAAASERK
ncbi:hypothetical protein GGD81_004473 [Rhodobium orientis]|uniref:hypothetical protein n=1 Tax=Rhodobium orientis TaxID=34017 RepID=UPI0011B93555|nr:hypothetical protein [Rhodobium orientis]MBB4305397.1 hypothetical protein [Rhodobium orientis]